ncbi:MULTISPECIES: adenosylcobinamide-GDP ribazoletransferase [Afifella]|uniref:adenosylcobinamide-GDP ribazoletransferase n=1 Tax=Afifella TaxID=643217 RepID=UPI000FE3F6E2|nr:MULTISPECIES: adenosylcobinamide-GDP ribazoletransferase [Afifella]MCT8266614.1 adenosylcobinamide-GDP ribazoletransferase [Afifella sp. JA880]
MSSLAQHFTRLPQDLRACLAFLSRLPIRAKPEPSEERPLSVSSACLPLAGMLIALTPAVILSLIISFGGSTVLAAAVALGAMALITGGLHEDGLGDTADGFGGGKTREQRLEIMHDSRIGTYALLALLFTVIIKVVALGEISQSVGVGAFSIICVAALSRALAYTHWTSLPPARTDGVASWAGWPKTADLGFAVLLSVPAILILIVMFPFTGILAIILATLGVFAFSAMARRLIGGHTGDTIGASEQIAATILFATLALGA